MQAPDPDALVARVLSFVTDRDVLRPGPLLVAVSGGQDSVCMLHILRTIAPELGLELHVAHLNHSFRGAQAEEDAAFVQKLAAAWGLPVEVSAIDVPAYRTRHHLSKQVAARYARFQFLVRAAAHAGTGQIALGHTSNDAAETLLLNLLRGAGLAGMSGVLPSRHIQPGQLGPALESQHWLTPELPPAQSPLPRVVRPVLHLSRAETEAYCRTLSLPFRSDPSNLDTSYRRNWIRADLMPMLERRAPGAVNRLLASAELLADDHALVASQVDRLWKELARQDEGRVELPLEPWSRLEAPVQRHLLRRALEALAGSLEDVGRVHLDALVRVIASGSVGARVDLPRGIYLEKGYNSFWLKAPGAPAAEPVPLPSEPVPLPVPGSAVLPAGLIEAALGEPRPADRTAPDGGAESRWEAKLDATRVGPVLEVRRRRPGDRFVPLGMAEPKKLQDFLVDQKVPRGERDSVPIVATPDAIVWVAGHRIDDRFKVTEHTRRVLILTYKA